MKIIFKSLLVVSSFIWFSCKDSGKNNTESEYKLFNLEQIGWKSRSVLQHFSGISYTATLVPIQYYLLKNGNSQNIDSLYTIHKTERVIEMEFKNDNKDDLLKSIYTKKDYESSVKYMSFSIENDFAVVTQSGDTIPCSGVNFERNYKIAPFKRLLLHFGNIPEDEKIQLIYNDKLFNNGIIKFKFQEIPIKL